MAARYRQLVPIYTQRFYAGSDGSSPPASNVWRFFLLPDLQVFPLARKGRCLPLYFVREKLADRKRNLYFSRVAVFNYPAPDFPFRHPEV